jgi:hypothetical protein
MDAGGRATQDAKADDCMDAGGRATQDAKADDCMDAGGRATQDAKAEESPNVAKCLTRILNRCAHFEMTRVG